jgi:transposase-like protein
MGDKPKNMHRSKRPTWGHTHAENKTAVLSLVDTTNGEVRSEVVRDVTGSTIAKVMARQVDLPGSTLHTDEAKHYLKLGSSSGHTSPSTTPMVSTSGAPSPPTLPRATFHSSSGPSTAPTTPCPAFTCPATSQRSTGSVRSIMGRRWKDRCQQ